MSPYREEFSDFVSIPPKPIHAANKRTFMATGHGTITILLPNRDRNTTVRLFDVLYAPSIAITLISASHIDEAGYSIHLQHGICQISDPSNRIVARIPRTNNLYKVVSHTLSSSAQLAKSSPLITCRGEEEEASANLVLSAKELHRRLGHISLKSAKKLITDGLVKGITLNNHSTDHELCTACV